VIGTDRLYDDEVEGQLFLLAQAELDGQSDQPREQGPALSLLRLGVHGSMVPQLLRHAPPKVGLDRIERRRVLLARCRVRWCVCGS
jgi:hypothetical protein